MHHLKFKFTGFFKVFTQICGCEIKNCVFCFTCILYGGDLHWTNSGINDLVHLSEKAKATFRPQVLLA
jgi:hypothetical protein